MLQACLKSARYLLFVLPVMAFAGQSIVLSPAAGFNTIDPIVAANQSWRIEFQLHNWTLPPSSAAILYQLSGTGATARLMPQGLQGSLDIETSDPVAQQQPCIVNLPGSANVLVRVQKDAATMHFSCEVWNYDGSGYTSTIENMTALQPRTSSGGTVGFGASTAMGFLRVSTTLVALGGRPPTTADGGNWTELKFDGDLKDSSGNGHSGSGSGFSFITTPNQVAFANPKTSGAPTWANWTSLRAGFPAQLDGTASYSLADASSTVSYNWQELNGPSNLTWSNQNTATPTINGLIFGTYDFTLQVMDVAGNSSTAKLEVGAVATDNNGVVVNADPNVDKLFGPMIAYGKNPWGYMDQRAMSATRLRMAAYNAQGLNPPSWASAGSGSQVRGPSEPTVSYKFNGVGQYPALPGTVLASAVPSAGATTIAIADASPLDLSRLPTRILLGSFPREEVRICGTSATQGPATLTVCYDGRGQSSPADGYRLPAQAWPGGASVGQIKVNGSGTTFLSDICPMGPGPNGPASYTAGTLQLTPGSTAVTGIGTNWTIDNGVIPNAYLIRVSATHGGVPFLFVAYIAALTDPAHMTLARPYPADADGGSFAYSVIQADYRQIALHYTRPDNTDGQLYFSTSGCESDTEVYLYLGHDIAGLNQTLQTGKQYSYINGYGYTSAFGANFYGEDIAHRALYYRSGWAPALEAARVFGDHYISSPQIAGGDAKGLTLTVGGGIIGGYFAAILDTSDPDRPSWSDLRRVAQWGATAITTTCNGDDTRDTGYEGAWLTLAANYDPDPVQRANWKTLLGQLYARDLNCKGPDNSWANSALWGPSSAPLNMTQGSAIVTGSNLPPSMCYGIASGTMSVTNGSAIGSGSGFVAGNKIVVTGTMNGAPYTGFFQFNINANGTITMAALWPGDSGGATYMIENNDYLTAIGTSTEDPQLTKNRACIWNSPSQITLDRPWDGPTVAGAYATSYVITGFGQQPFMLGIKITQMKLASQNDDPTLSSNYAALAKQAAQWIHDVGYDPVTQGLFYGRIFQACEPLTIPPPGSNFVARTPGCNQGLFPPAIDAARVLTSEASQALRVYYESNPTAAAKAWGDTAYGSIWGNPQYTASGYYSDPYYVYAENSDLSLGGYKWTGFFFGMGMAHQWPAVRLGGVAQAQYRKVNLDVRQGLAAKTRVSVTAPSSAVTVYDCGSRPGCEILVDDRQGSHWYRIQYLAEDGRVIAQSEPALLDARPHPEVLETYSRR